MYNAKKKLYKQWTGVYSVNEEKIALKHKDDESSKLNFSWYACEIENKYKTTAIVGSKP